MRRGQSKEESMRDRLNALANLVIMVTLAVMLLRPSGPIAAWVAEWKQSHDSQSKIASVWNVLVEGPSLFRFADSEIAPVVEFIDYQCPICQSVGPQVESAATNSHRGVVIRHFPLSIHDHAESAARAAICAEAEGKFVLMHQKLLTLSDWSRTQDWVAVAISAGIDDVDGFASCLMSESTERRLEVDRRLAEGLGVRGTPTFVTPGGIFSGGGEIEAAFRSSGRPK